MTSRLIALIATVSLCACASVQSVARDALEDAGVMCCDLSTGECEYHDALPQCGCADDGSGDGSGDGR